VTGGWGGLWLRVGGPHLDEQHALVLDVAAAATISFGAGLSGAGELLVSKLAFEEVGDEVPVTAGPIAHGSR
jgi:hypothetical protein